MLGGAAGIGGLHSITSGGGVHTSYSGGHGGGQHESGAHAAHQHATYHDPKLTSQFIESIMIKMRQDGGGGGVGTADMIAAAHHHGARNDSPGANRASPM